MTQRRLWFKAKNYGWGWTPATWEGWVATAIYCGGFGLWLVYWVEGAGRDNAGVLAGAAPLVLMTAGYIALCYAKGEKPRWQWGKRRVP